MNVISRIRFPQTTETAGLYMKCHDSTSLNLCTEQAEAIFKKNGVLSLNTYFNSFFENFYAKYTHLSSLYYLLKLEGSFQISLYRESHNKDDRDLIHIQNFDNCQPSQPVKISLSNSQQSEDAGRIYLEITCLSERGLFLEGFIATDKPKIREVSLGIITCTFKKEAYVRKTISTILKDKFLQDKKYQVFVVDNGKTLNEDDFEQQRVQLIPNRNVGGSGGFTYGLIQALQGDVNTHFLFMDDDIELESESLYRLFSLYEYAKVDFAVSGSMLDLYKKHILSEAGAMYGRYLAPDGEYQYNPFTVVALKRGLNLENSANTNLLISEDNPDYGGFWFFSFSRKTIQEMGLPLPFFIKVDDMEFGLRIKERLSKSIVAFPGIAVWHEPFYAKTPVWDIYYEFRNRLITHSLRSSLKYLDAIKFITQGLLHKLFLFDYNSAEMVINAFEDYMQGPVFIKSNEPETLHAKVLGISKSYKSQSVQENYFNNSINENFMDEKHEVTIFNKIIGIVTLNGHLLPNFLLSKDDVLFRITSDSSDWWTKVFGKKRVVIFSEGNKSVRQHEMSRVSGISILIRWLHLVIKSATQWSSVNTQWRNAFKYFTSTEFWKDYLKLNEQT
ncbi:MAG: glycosyltransferase [Rhizonema sp. PD38]|nr:glycosyltransferase [Rhizonema sp. PD38]